MARSLLNKESLDIKFISIAKENLKQIQSQKWSDSNIELLKFKNIEQLIITLDEIKPKSLIREEKKMLITYLEKLIKISDNEVSRKDVIFLRKKYIVPILNYKLDSFDYRIAGSWIYSLFFTLPIDFILNYFFGKILFYIPIFTIITIVVSIRKDLIAKRNNRLW